MRGISNTAGAWACGLGRAAVGVALLSAPEKLSEAWVGTEAAGTPAAQVLARALGAREVLLGAGAIYALARGCSPRPWLAAAAVADLVDAAVTVGARDRIPRANLAFAAAVASGSAAANGHYAYHYRR